MVNIVAGVFFALIAAGSIFVGIRYMNAFRNNHNDQPSRQELIKQNRQTYGVSDPEASEIEEVSVVEYDKLGIKE